jgi:hypothetical protein
MDIGVESRSTSSAQLAVATVGAAERPGGLLQEPFTLIIRLRRRPLRLSTPEGDHFGVQKLIVRLAFSVAIDLS